MDNDSLDPPFVHETAIVEPGARLGRGCRVWHHAHVRTGAVLGERVSLGKNVFVDAGVVIGDGTRIQNNVSVYAGVQLENDVFVGPSAVFTNDLTPRAQGDWEIVTTTVRSGASIGANATIIGGNEIGAYALVGAGAVVTRAVAPYELVLGNPARRAGWVCRCGRVLARSNELVAGIRCEHCGFILE